jgi:hypothetical protein
VSNIVSKYHLTYQSVGCMISLKVKLNSLLLISVILAISSGNSQWLLNCVLFRTQKMQRAPWAHACTAWKEFCGRSNSRAASYPTEPANNLIDHKYTHKPLFILWSPIIKTAWQTGKQNTATAAHFSKNSLVNLVCWKGDIITKLSDLY